MPLTVTENVHHLLNWGIRINAECSLFTEKDTLTMGTIVSERILTKLRSKLRSITINHVDARNAFWKQQQPCYYHPLSPQRFLSATSLSFSNGKLWPHQYVSRGWLPRKDPALPSSGWDSFVATSSVVCICWLFVHSVFYCWLLRSDKIEILFQSSLANYRNFRPTIPYVGSLY